MDVKVHAGTLFIQANYTERKTMPHSPRDRQRMKLYSKASHILREIYKDDFNKIYNKLLEDAEIFPIRKRNADAVDEFRQLMDKQ